MQQSQPARAALGLAPVIQAGDGRSCGGDESYADCEVSGASEAIVARGRLTRVQRQRRRPRARSVHPSGRMQRMPQPHAVQGVLRRSAGGTRVLKQGHDRLAERLASGIEPWLVRDGFQVRLRHTCLP